MPAPDRSRLRPEFRAMMEELDRQVAPPLDTVTPQELRAAAEIDFPALWGPAEPVAAVEEIVFGSGGAAVKARLYRPDRAQGTAIFLHGGGWVVGSLATHDGSCRRLATAAHADVGSLGYRKAPEHPYRAPLADAWAGVEFALAKGLAGDGLAIGGEGAGGTLAAVSARRARDRGVALAGQLLIYPAT